MHRFFTLIFSTLLFACTPVEDEGFGDSQAKSELEAQWDAVAVNNPLAIDVYLNYDLKDVEIDWQVQANPQYVQFTRVDNNSTKVTISKAGYYTIKAVGSSFSEEVSKTYNIYAGNAKHGSILTDTTWTLNESPILLTDHVEIDEGVTLTIEPGVDVASMHMNSPITSSEWFYGKRFSVYGNLIIDGSDTQSTNMRAVNINSLATTNTADSTIKLNYVDFTSGFLSMTYYVTNPNGRYNVQNSTLKNLYQIKFNNFASGSIFKNNVVEGVSDKISIYSYRDVEEPFQIIGNSFSNMHAPLEVSVDPINDLIFQNNTFVDTGTEVIKLTTTTKEDLDASTTNWGTTDSAIIDNMIWDRNDSLSLDAFVLY